MKRSELEKMNAWPDHELEVRNRMQSELFNQEFDPNHPDGGSQYHRPRRSRPSLTQVQRDALESRLVVLEVEAKSIGSSIGHGGHGFPVPAGTDEAYSKWVSLNNEIRGIRDKLGGGR